jgi:hypothetical protein
LLIGSIRVIRIAAVYQDVATLEIRQKISNCVVYRATGTISQMARGFASCFVNSASDLAPMAFSFTAPPPPVLTDQTRRSDGRPSAGGAPPEADHSESHGLALL